MAAPFLVWLGLVLHDFGLCVAFDRAATPETRSRCLADMARRGGPVVVRFLTRKHGDILTRRRAGGAGSSGDDSTVELLTALRRAEGRPAPVPVLVRGPDPMESIFPNLPAVEAALVNRDEGEAPVTFQEGGDYRSGRQDRWRFAVLDARGKSVPVKQHQGVVIGGGLSRMGILKPGETWETTLSMRRFIDLPAGDYTVIVEYHDRETIAGLPNTAGLVVCRSEPFPLHVQPRVIDLTRADRAAAREAIAALPEKGPVRILGGQYGKGAHDFIRPESGPGRLLALGWRAVPALLDALEDDAATGQRRAWVFAALYSVTGLNDPRHDNGLLAGYESREGTWAVSGGRGGHDRTMGFGLGGRSSSSGGEFDPAAQRAFAKQWLAVRESIVVRERP